MVKGHEDFSFSADVKTLNADNLFIDILTLGAYKARVDTLINNGATPTWTAPTGATRRAKLFPRGARGFLRRVGIYCKNTGAAAGQVYIELWQAPYLGPFYSDYITVAAGATEAWRNLTVNKMWNYDSLLIVVYTSSSNVQIAYDTGGPDAFNSIDSGLNWSGDDSARYWFRAEIQGMTAGDVPVTGTINAITVPAVSSAYIEGQNTNLGTGGADIYTLWGSGRINFLTFRVAANTDSQLVQWGVYCDETLVFWETAESLGPNGYGFTASTPGISLLRYTANGVCVIHLTMPFSFRRKLRIYAQAQITSGQNVRVVGSANLIR